METNFIRTNELINVKYYGIRLRLDVVIVGDKPFLWIVTKRTIKKENEDWSFANCNDANRKLKQLISELYCSPMDALSEKI